ncbi:DUF4367 domain-containing protein [Alicyclobacillus macrosporangiidus]|uniref:DUF4367 domain-containing protein n=1 Tax=Alicyclobacillus macrosporangiidus TaxID=392015 RepID=A0A1I7HHS1_9BACL|nr:DUF4367 domain-containing protein [Alicyclobacillus macrosporangiidus]SFU60297.1 protein of unknown function [Alicyclobacillus macrosporangiidus]
MAERIEQGLAKRVEPRHGLRRAVIGTGLVGVLLIGANTAVWAATGRSLLDVIVQTHRISAGDGMISGWAFIPAGGASPTAGSPPVADNGLQPVTATGPSSAPKPETGTKLGTPMPLHAQKETLGLSADGKHFTADHYNSSLSDFLGTDRFPKLNTDGAQVDWVEASMKDKVAQQFDLDVTGVIPVNGLRHVIRMVLYHNHAGSFQIDGDTSAPGNTKREVKLNGQDATYITFTNGHTTQRYLTWNRGPWVILLTGDLPEGTFMQVAQSVDRQAQADVPLVSNLLTQTSWVSRIA